jgi:hypothetical protein
MITAVPCYSGRRSAVCCKADPLCTAQCGAADWTGSEWDIACGYEKGLVAGLIVVVVRWLGLNRCHRTRGRDYGLAPLSVASKEFFRGVAQQIQLRTESRDNGDLKSVAP